MYNDFGSSVSALMAVKYCTEMRVHMFERINNAGEIITSMMLLT